MKQSIYYMFIFQQYFIIHILYAYYMYSTVYSEIGDQERTFCNLTIIYSV